MMHPHRRTSQMDGAGRARKVACSAIVLLALFVAGCATGRAIGRAEDAARMGDWDTAVAEYRRAVQSNPGRTDYQIALERAMMNASRVHLDQARLFEAQGRLDDALREYRRASEYDPPNRSVAAKVTEMERRIRDQVETTKPQPTIAQLRERARTPEPLLNPASREPLSIRFNNASLRDIFGSISSLTGINVTYDRDFQDRAYTVQLNGVTLEEALNQILSANQLFYKVINERTIMVIPDNAQKRAQYEEQVIRTFFISHSDATELAQMINQVIRVPAMAVQPVIAANKTNNTITVRATTAVASIIEKLIESNDNPRAEIVVDVQILEVNRARAKTFGLDLSSYQVTTAFSPETDPRGTGDNAGALNPQPFNLSTISRGVSTADFYLAVPSAIVKFLESDAENRLIAKPQLRGAEGSKITLNLGDEIPVPSTVFTPVAQGGANFNPLTSFTYRPVGVNIEMTPRVTFEDEIILDLLVESSTRGQDQNVAGQNLPTFGSRKVVTRLRLRDGESNLLAGLLREDERRTLKSIPGILRIPILNKLLASNDNEIRQTDIVMLLTPRIVRTHELVQQDVSPIYIGTQQNLGLGGPPPLIAAPNGAAEPAAATPAAPPQPAGGGVIVVPPGSNSVPGTTTVPAAPSPPAPAGPEAAPQLAAPQGTAGATPDTATTVAGPAAGTGGQIVITTPGNDFRVGGGPYTVPLSVTSASRLSSISITVAFNPSVLRVRNVQEGTFMRTGGGNATFTQRVDAAAGRVDIAIVRAGDVTGVSGTGVLAALLFDAIGPGTAGLNISAAGSDPTGAPIALQFGTVPVVQAR